MDGWQAALTLQERRELVGDGQPGAAARQRCQRWRAQPPFTDERWWQTRWARAGIAESALERLLDPPLHATPPPAWLSTFQACYAADDAWQTPGWLSTPSLLEAILPLLNWALRSADQRCRDLVAQPVAFAWERVLDSLHGWLGQRLAQLAAPLLALELNIARTRGDLHGADAEGRFVDFVRRFPAQAPDLLLKYPVLVRLLVEEATSWTAAVVTLVTRLQQDWPQIVATFAPAGAAGACVDVRLGAGDSHNGQSVSMLHFASGWRLVYKPRSLSCERQFQQLLAWHNTSVAGACDLPEITLLERGTYGWMEYIQAAPCPDRAAAERFYRRQGHYLALLYVLEASDMHYENIVAAGEYPYLIDLEGLCQPQLTEQPAPASVRRIGLLPLRLWSHGAYAGVDLSGLGGSANQALPGVHACWQDLNRDTMAVGYRPAETAAALNRPQLNDQPLQSASFVAQIVAGFEQTYHSLLAHRSRLEDTILAGFSTALVRVIARPTQSYAIILRHSLHPNVCRDASDRERILDYLWLAVPQQPWLQALVAAEQRALWRNDVPWFGTQPRSHTLVTADGEQLADGLPHSGWEAVQQRISQLSAADCAAQIALIRASLELPASAPPEPSLD
jgi:type 2 lantibiotic biosynthesis protein LanM